MQLQLTVISEFKLKIPSLNLELTLIPSKHLKFILHFC